MKKTFFLAVVLALFILVGLGVNKANAAWFLCDVTRVGIVGNEVMVRLTATESESGDPLFTGKWFKTSTTNPTEQNRILATLLTAISLERQVKIAVSDMSPTYPIIGNFYLF